MTVAASFPHCPRTDYV